AVARRAEPDAARQDRLRVSGLQPGPGADRVRERRDGPAPAGRADGRAQATGDEAARRGRARGHGASQAGRDVGWSAAAGRDRPGDRAGSGGDAGRRADRQRRLGDRRDAAVADGAAQSRARRHVHLLDPRSAGDGSRATGDSDGRRQDRERRAQGVVMNPAVVLALTLAGPEPEPEQDEQQSAWEAAGWGAPEPEPPPVDITAPVEIIPPSEAVAPVEVAAPTEPPDTAASAWDQPSADPPAKDKLKVGDVLMGSLRLTGSYLHFDDEP